ncbi:MAG: 5-(carboxyamino)imidazole ribonucleotide synthase [Pirellulales bacterium]|nr:5-(carboxyamino)imidazole ribonucleotide synthase [Pirellulales bacterium]
MTRGRQGDGPVLPGATVGVLGSGQLGRMFAIAARRMGYRVHTFSPDDDTPTGQVADLEIKASYLDLDAVRNFARGVSVVTFEFENVPAGTAEAAAELAQVRPAGSVLHVTQHRLREKTFLRERGFPVAPFAAVRSYDELMTALAQIGTPAILKTAGWGYDGKGQARVENQSSAAAAWRELATDESILEGFIDFAAEASVVAARGVDGSFVAYPLVANHHVRHILDTTHAPAAWPPGLEQSAHEITRGVLEALGVVGVLCVEFFVTRDGQLLVNELAPRPHNSGHFTFDACVTSQFEQQLRSICGLPLGSTELLRPAAMANLLGDVWASGEPDWAAALAMPDVKLHLYGKAVARPGRKMGHLTALANTADEALRRVLAAREALARR